MLAATAKFLRQIIPPVIATLIAAVLIAGFNRAFSDHLTQPRMGMLHRDTIGTDARRRAATRTRADGKAARTATDAIVVAEPVSADNRVPKDNDREAAKDDTALKLTAAAPAAGPGGGRAAAPHAEPAPVEPPARAGRARTPPVMVAPRVVERRRSWPRPVRQAPVCRRAAADGDGAGPPASAAAGADRASRPRHRRRAPIGTIVNTLKPSSLFARAREFGEKIEAAGNEILPSIRQ